MSKTTETHAIIVDLEAQGYTITIPRDHQSEWEMSIANMLGFFHASVRNPFERHQADMRDRSRVTLSIIHREIGEMLANANQKVAEK